MAKIEIFFLLTIGFLMIFCLFAGDVIGWMLEINPDE